MLRKVAYIGLELKEHSIPEKVERKTQETDKFLLLSLPWVSRTRRSSVAISLFLVYIYMYIYICILLCYKRYIMGLIINVFTVLPDFVNVEMDWK